MKAHLIVGFLMINKIQYSLSSNIYNNWPSVLIISEINDLSRTFQLDITPKVYAQNEIRHFSFQSDYFFVYDPAFQILICNVLHGTLVNI